MSNITLPRATVEQALEALESVDWYLSQLEEIVYSSGDIGQHEERAKAQPAMQALRAALAQPNFAQRVVDEQAEDEGLWFRAQTAAEAYLQQELRRLHAAVEGEK